MIKRDVIETFLKVSLGSAAAISGKIAPLFLDKKKIEKIKNVSYGSHRDQILDIYYPKTPKKSPLPITMLIHGGGFRFFSKDSHATAAHQLAGNGHLVFNINYRLTPQHPYPSGLIDAILAYSWMVQNAEKHGGDLNNISLVGESAGGNFALALCLHLFGIKTLNTQITLPEIPANKPKHAVIHCGHLHVSNIDRYIENKDLHPIVLRRLQQIQRDYLPDFAHIPLNEAGLADPLIEIEKLVKNKTNLPPGFPKIFVPVGDRDPVGGDSFRLAQAFEALGQKNSLRVYPGEGHAFYIMPFRKGARLCWDDIFNFLNT